MSIPNEEQRFFSGKCWQQNRFATRVGILKSVDNDGKRMSAVKKKKRISDWLIDGFSVILFSLMYQWSNLWFHSHQKEQIIWFLSIFFIFNIHTFFFFFIIVHHLFLPPLLHHFVLDLIPAQRKKCWRTRLLFPQTTEEKSTHSFSFFLYK